MQTVCTTHLPGGNTERSFQIRYSQSIIIRSLGNFFPTYITRIVKYIGSGQFGTVNLAVWKQPYVEPMEVAVKVCRAGNNEAIKAKFLKEAAIMGQFRHPNVVKLYGVVTMSELVRKDNGIYITLYKCMFLLNSR